MSSRDETPAPPAVPVSERRPVTDHLHGNEVVDDYRWLEGDNSDPDRMGQVTAEVATWTDAQNAYTRAVLDHLPGRRELEDRLRPLLQIGTVSAPEERGGRYFYFRREGDQNQASVYFREGLRGAEQLLIDPVDIDASGLTTVTWLSPSPDGRQLAYGTYRAGDENTKLELLDVDTRAKLPLEIHNKVRPPQWLPDGSGFLYWKLADPADAYSGRVMFHPRPEDATAAEDDTRDRLVFRQYTKEEDEKLATTWGPSGTLSRDGHWMLLSYMVDTRSNDLWLVDFEEFRRNGEVNRVEVSVGTAGLGLGSVVEGSAGPTLVLYTYKGAPNGRVVAAPVESPGEQSWQDIVPEREDATIEAASLAAGHVVVTYLEKATSRVEVFDLEGRSVGDAPLPAIGTASVKSSRGSHEAFVTFSSFAHPNGVYRFDVRDPAGTFELWERPEAPVDPESVVVKQAEYPSQDGTVVSMFIAHRRDVEPGRDSPTILYGYGGFGVSEVPAFSPTVAQWLEDGGVYALPNLRGGGEYGDAWHEAGTLERKQNVFDDFIAAAEWLLDNGYTSKERLAIAGGSNGGLLTGAAITQRPELFSAVIIAVPLLDMLRYQHFLMARYWVPEYGSAEEPEQFEWLNAYSPYQRVIDGTAYPAVLLTAGENDTRVHALHARKMAARLQAATTSDPEVDPVLLWVDRSAGHGQGKPLDLRLRDAVDQRIFIMWQLGMLD